MIYYFVDMLINRIQCNQYIIYSEHIYFFQARKFYLHSLNENDAKHVNLKITKFNPCFLLFVAKGNSKTLILSYNWLNTLQQIFAKTVI